MSKVIDIGKDFSPTPAGRFPSEGPFSGEAFRERLLVPALAETKSLAIVLDNTEGYGSSFLEEAFGGLVRVHGFSPQELRQRLRFVTSDPSLREEILSYIDEAE